MAASKNFDLYAWAKTSPWWLAASALEHCTRVFLWGPPGVGKSYLALARRRSAAQVTLCDDHTVHDLIGHFVPDGRQFRWHDGPVAGAMRAGSLLVLNEVGRASGAVLDFLLGVLDSDDVNVLSLPSAERLKPASGFAVVATSNSPPDALDPALRSRFEAEVHLPTPAPPFVAELNQKVRGLGDALADSFLDPDRALDPRKVLTLARLVGEGVPAREAAAICFDQRAPDVIAALEARGVVLGGLVLK